MTIPAWPKDEPVTDRPVAVFDSGLGGLSVVRELRRLLPHETIVYFGDTARVPYGTKSPETVARFAREILAFLMRLTPKCVVAACNTVSAVGLPGIAGSQSIPVIGVVRPGAEAAIEAVDQVGGEMVAIIATTATVASNAYQQALGRLNRQVIAVQKACPLLVPLVEEGRDSDDALVTLAVAQYLEPLIRLQPDVLLMACTHYPLIRPAIARCLGPKVTLVDSATATARKVASVLTEQNALSTTQATGKLLCYVSDNPQRFQSLGTRFLGEPISSVVRVRPNEFESIQYENAPKRLAAG